MATRPIWDPNATTFPLRSELPSIPGAPEGACWFWGADDSLGRVNLLTPTRIKAAATHIRTGEAIPIDLPLDQPDPPAFGRRPFDHKILELAPDRAFDDVVHMNTQSSTQWDGLRHAGVFATGVFYNGVSGEEIKSGRGVRSGVQAWAEHRIVGRGVLLDYVGYRKGKGGRVLGYSPFEAHGIGYEELVECGKAQGLDVRPKSQGGDIEVGDILFVRTGWKEAYDGMSKEERVKMQTRENNMQLGPANPTTFAGVKQEVKILDWLHDCYFAAVAGDAPSFEVWPSQEGMFYVFSCLRSSSALRVMQPHLTRRERAHEQRYSHQSITWRLGRPSRGVKRAIETDFGRTDYYLHEYILPRWGMPLGEMFDLEKVAATARRNNQWFFFFTSAPANVPGGIASAPNGTAIF